MDKKSPFVSEDIRSFIIKIFIILLFIGWLYLLSFLTPVLTILFFSGFLTILFAPILDSLSRKKIPNGVGLILVFLGVFLFFFIALFAIIPIFVKQMSILFSTLSDIVAHLEALYRTGGIDALPLPASLRSTLGSVDFVTLFEFLRSQTGALSGMFLTGTKNILIESKTFLSSLSGGIFQIVMIVVFTFFMSLERREIKTFLYQVLPSRATQYLLRREDSFQNILTLWIRWQLLLSLSIFILTLIGLLIIKVFGIQMSHIATLALIAGMMEFIPYVGPLIALLPALAIAATLGVWPAIIIIVLYIAIQQLENHVLVPLIMSRTLSISPFLILLVMTVMTILFGIVGILLAIPLAAIIQMVVGDMIGDDVRKGRK